MAMNDDEYSKAFNSNESEEDGAAESVEREPAAAVTINNEVGNGGEEAGESAVVDAPAVDQADEQREKSWEGRLKKMEQELKAREAALAEKESALTADGGPAQANEIQGGEESPESGETPSEENAEETPAVQRIRAEAMRLMQSGGLDAAIRDAVDNFGEEFLVLSAALSGLLFDDLAKPYIDDMGQSLESLVGDVTTAFASRDFEAISEAHEDVETIVESPEFNAYLDGLDDDAKAAAQKVVDSGSPRQVVKLLNDFKSSLKSREQSPEELWAQDAAEGVRSSSALKLPTRPEPSADDDYERAWNSSM